METIPALCAVNNVRATSIHTYAVYEQEPFETEALYEPDNLLAAEAPPLASVLAEIGGRITVVHVYDVALILEMPILIVTKQGHSDTR